MIALKQKLYKTLLNKEYIPIRLNLLRGFEFRETLHLIRIIMILNEIEDRGKKTQNKNKKIKKHMCPQTSIKIECFIFN